MNVFTALGVILMAASFVGIGFAAGKRFQRRADIRACIYMANRFDVDSEGWRCARRLAYIHKHYGNLLLVTSLPLPAGY
jgi:hypothetical protein